MTRGFSPRRLPSVALLALLPAVAALSDEPAPAEPLHVRIDRVVDEASSGVAAPITRDHEFLRRVTLDLNGVTPSTQELRAFLLDPAPDKRARAIDRLLDSPLFARNMANVLDIMLMERRPARAVGNDEWLAFLESSIREQRPLNEVFREILSADGVDAAKRPAAHFYLDREGEPNLIARDVGRIFFGRDLQCAQCHDSPLVDDYHQSDYKGLFAFFEGGTVVSIKEGDKDKTYYGERAAGDVAFESVFVKGTRHVTAARLPGDTELVEPVFHPGDEYQVKPADGVVPVPKFSRRAQIAERATSGTNRVFNENWANRLWGHMLGRGLVHPVDMVHSGNPASYPELLTLLGNELAASHFSLKSFLREIALTKVYQRAIDSPERILDKASVAADRLAKLTASRPPLAAALEATQAAYEAATEKHRAAEAALLPGVDELNAARTKGAEADKKVAEAEAAVVAARADLTKKESAAQTLKSAIESASNASNALADDKELAALIPKLQERATQLAAGIETQKKVIEERVQAVPAVTAERATAWQELDAVVAKVEPLREAVRVAERELLDARMKMMDDVAILGRLDERLHDLSEFVEYKRVAEEAEATEAKLATVQSTADEVRQKMADQAMLIAEKQIELTAAESAIEKSSKEIADLGREQATLHEAQKFLDQAFAAAETGLQSSMIGTKVAPIVEMLKSKSTETRDETAAVDSRLAQATKLQADSQTQKQSAAEALQSALAENSRRFEGVRSAQSTLQTVAAEVETQQAEMGQAKGELAQSWSRDFSLAALKPLTPEQMCWSLLRITGVYEQQRQAQEAELEKASPLSEEAKKDPAQVAAREAQIDKSTYDKLKGNVGAFVTYFAAAAGQPQGDFFATPDQALFVANGGTVNNWIAAGLSVATRVAAEADPVRAAEDLYLSVLSRMPSEVEINDVTDYLSKRSGDRPEAARELVWALVTSTEFRFNH